MRPDISFLQDIVHNTELLIQFTTTTTRTQFLQDEMRKMAVEKGIERIGEAMKNISASLKNRYEDVDWTGFPRMRDRTAHGYWSVDYEIVWNTVTLEIPQLRKQILAILEQES